MLQGYLGHRLRQTWIQIPVLPYLTSQWFIPLSLSFSSSVRIAVGSNLSSLGGPTAANHPQSCKPFPFTNISKSMTQIFTFDWVLRKSRLSWKSMGHYFIFLYWNEQLQFIRLICMYFPIFQISHTQLSNIMELKRNSAFQEFSFFLKQSRILADASPPSLPMPVNKRRQT